ncbi:HSP20-like chaperone [Mariannaea sp. PMI_226]|nr:HSP20-like chaperone [Mariannaea sp. PMI_226]
MSLFTRNFYNPEMTFTPLLRLLDDFDNYSRQDQSGQRTGLLHWQPNFDIYEKAEAYELHGELPGMKKEEVHIEFIEPQTMVICGKTKRAYTIGNPPEALLEGNTMHGAITEGKEGEEVSKQLTAEAAESSTKPAEQRNEGQERAAKYWLIERKVGEFSRTFNFPSHVDQEAVSAKFEDGILNIVVPKTKTQHHRRIHVD